MNRGFWFWANLVAMALVLYMSLLAIFVTINTNTMKAKYSQEYSTISVYDLEPGDLFFVRSNFKSGLIPGYWSHTAIFWGFDENNTPLVVEAMSYKPVRFTSVYDYIERRQHYIIAKVQGVDAETKRKAADWAAEQVGKPFDYWYPSKQANGSSFYCSELLWAAYLNVAGIDFDTGKYLDGVAPQEIFDDSRLVVYNLK